MSVFMTECKFRLTFRRNLFINDFVSIAYGEFRKYIICLIKRFSQRMVYRETKLVQRFAFIFFWLIHFEMLLSFFYSTITHKFWYLFWIDQIISFSINWLIKIKIRQTLEINGKKTKAIVGRISIDCIRLSAIRGKLKIDGRQICFKMNLASKDMEK